MSGAAAEGQAAEGQAAEGEAAEGEAGAVGGGADRLQPLAGAEDEPKLPPGEGEFADLDPVTDQEQRPAGVTLIAGPQEPVAPLPVVVQGPAHAPVRG